MRILHIDSNHPILLEKLNAAGFKNDLDFESDIPEILKKLPRYEGVVIRSRIPVDQAFFEAALQLKFIARVGAGMENIDKTIAEQKGITLISAPEGNRNAVAEHTLGLILSLFNKIPKANNEIHSGIWDREGNRGIELQGKTIGILGYGNMGKAFARILKGFECDVLCCDILPDMGDAYARQVPLKEIQHKADVLSLHTPLTALTENMVNKAFLTDFQNPIWLINTARGKIVNTQDLVESLRKGVVLGAGLDVLEYEKSSFEAFFEDRNIPSAFQELLHMEQVIFTPHIAGWTIESKEKLGEVIADKIIALFS